MNETQWLVLIAVVLAYLAVGVFIIADVSGEHSWWNKAFWFMVWLAWPVPCALVITAIFK